jgi:hypothetical protein
MMQYIAHSVACPAVSIPIFRVVLTPPPGLEFTYYLSSLLIQWIKRIWLCGINKF